MILKVYTLSDSSGETAELISKAAVSQFDNNLVEVIRLPQVKEVKQIKDFFLNTISGPAIIVYTLILDDVKQALIQEANKRNIPIYDVLSDLVSKLEKTLGAPSRHKPGLRLKMDESYFNRMDALHYAIKYDNGGNLTGIENADVLLLGISRTGKTPSCMYLAQHYGLKAANLPIILDTPPHEKLFEIDPLKIFGLVCNPLVLQSFRSTKASSGQTEYNPEYYDLDHIVREIEYSKTIFQKLKCHVVDMTNRAIEEITAEIISKLQIVRLQKI